MIQMREDTAEVTDSVTVAVGEGTRIHLIEDGVGPPLRARGPGSVGHANLLCPGGIRVSVRGTHGCALDEFLEVANGLGGHDAAEQHPPHLGQAHG